MKHILYLAVAVAATMPMPVLAAQPTSTVIRQIDTSALNMAYPQATVAAVGKTQIVVADNTNVRIYDKATGNLLLNTSFSYYTPSLPFSDRPNEFGGFPRVFYNTQANKFVLATTAYMPNSQVPNGLLLTSSLTSDALGHWRTSAVTLSPPTASNYKNAAYNFTLSMDASNLYVGTSQYGIRLSPSYDYRYVGEQISVVPLSKVYSGATTADFKTVALPNDGSGLPSIYGFQVQGVNSTNASAQGLFVSATTGNAQKGFSLDTSGAVPSASLPTTLAGTPYTDLGKVDQPALPNSIAPDYDNLVAASVFEHGGYIYMIQDVRPLVNGVGAADTVARLTVLRASDFSVVQQLDIGQTGFDVFNASLAVSNNGLVVGYNRSGTAAGVGNISVLANTYRFGANGSLNFVAEHFLQQSPVGNYRGINDYRWGPFSTVSVDPNDPSRFYVMGHYAKTSTTYGSILSELSLPALLVGGVPEPSSWAMMIAGFGLVGAAARRQRRALA